MRYGNFLLKVHDEKVYSPTISFALQNTPVYAEGLVQGRKMWPSGCVLNLWDRMKSLCTSRVKHHMVRC
jgi:tagatose-1,6-bisphosphate aldolase